MAAVCNIASAICSSTRREVTMSASVRRIHSKYLGEKTFPKEITEFEIREFFTLSAEDLRAIRVDSNKKSRLALALQVGFLRMTGAALDTYDYILAPFWSAWRRISMYQPRCWQRSRIVAPSHDSTSASELGLSVPWDISAERGR
jgi:hypothetical protein